MSSLNIISRRKRSGTSIKEMGVVKSEQAKGLTLEGKMKKKKKKKKRRRRRRKKKKEEEEEEDDDDDDDVESFKIHILYSVIFFLKVVLLTR
jgi:hypothetical protein